MNNSLNILFTIFMSFAFFFCHGQKKIDTKIILNGDIKPEDIYIRFDNGYSTGGVKSSLVDNVLMMNNEFYAPFGKIFIEYKKLYTHSFFVDHRPATIHLYYDQEKADAPFYYKDNINSVSIYDTISNDIYRDLRRYIREDLEKFNDFHIRYGDKARSNDSIRNELIPMVKVINEKSMSFLSAYCGDYFSFYYFADQVLSFSSNIENDLEYFKYLLEYFNTTFPEKYTSTEEGRNIRRKLEQKANSNIKKVLISADDIVMQDIDGNRFVLSDLKSKYVLLDFWATWCTPCIIEMPKIKELRSEFSVDQLDIISISIDHDSTGYADYLSNESMDWIHVLDSRAKTLANTFGIEAIPTIILINREGKIIYRSTGRVDKDYLKTIISQ